VRISSSDDRDDGASDGLREGSRVAAGGARQRAGPGHVLDKAAVQEHLVHWWPGEEAGDGLGDAGGDSTANLEVHRDARKQYDHDPDEGDHHDDSPDQFKASATGHVRKHHSGWHSIIGCAVATGSLSYFLVRPVVNLNLNLNDVEAGPGSKVLPYT
jgi:hypothetical protein